MVSGSASWSTHALLACADEGITICFLKSDGMPRARWIGRETKRGELAQRWQDFLDRPDWQSLYIQWRIALSRRAVRICAWRMGWSATGDPRSMHQAIHEATWAVANREELSVVRRRLHGMVYARALEELGRVGLGAGDVSASYLAPDLVTSVQWGLRPELTRWLARGRSGRNPCDAESYFNHRRVAVFLERHSAVVDFHLRDALGRLHRYLEGLQ